MNRSLLLIALLLATSASGSPLFENSELLEVKLSGPLSAIIKNRKVRSEYPFTLSTGDDMINLNVRIRGKSRIDLCRFPPLRLNFRGASIVDTIFSGQEKVKLVTHCKGNNDRTENYLLNEYTAYRIFNLISDKSYRVRLLKITFEDTDGKTSNLDRPYFGFVIESGRELAKRLGGGPADITRVRYSLLDSHQIALIYVFQYLIANTDWALVRMRSDESCCHNIDVMGIAGRLVPIPYDFDFSGLVNARYAAPDPALNLQRVTQRRYRGYCKSSIESVNAALGEIRALENEIMAVSRDVPALDEGILNRRVLFLDRFFEEAKNAENLLRRFERQCKGSD